MPDGSMIAPADADLAAALPMLDPRLFVWMSPSFPVGAFAYSHGLELAAKKGWVRDRASLENWLGELIELGSLRNDLILLAETWRAVAAGDRGQIANVNELAVVLQPSAERHLETVTQGNAFMATIEAAWPCPILAEMRPALGADVAYPVAVGLAAAAHSIGLTPTLYSYASAFVANLVSAAIRLSLIGQTDGQRVIAALMPTIAAAANTSAHASIDALGSATLRSDLASLAHETQYTRLFRS